MGDSHQRRDRKVRLDYAFDRLLITKLQQAYEIPVPHQVRAVRDSVLNGDDGDEERSDLRAGILTPAQCWSGQLWVVCHEHCRSTR